MSCTMVLLLPPPLKVRASQIFSRGFIISQNFWNVSFGVLLFSEISQISDTFRTLFGSFSKHFPLVKQQKVPIFFRARVARGDSLLKYEYTDQRIRVCCFCWIWTDYRPISTPQGCPKPLQRSKLPGNQRLMYRKGFPEHLTSVGWGLTDPSSIT